MLRNSTIIVISFCLLLLLSACQSTNHATGVRVQVQRVVSGQTIKVILAEKDNAIATVRLIGINAPDLNQKPWGEAAKKELEKLLNYNSQEQKSLILLESDLESPDRFGRILAHVWHNDILVSEKLVEEGYVLADSKYPHQYSQRLFYAQEYARINESGIWNPKQPMSLTPSEFRSQNLAK